jgi:hypothetical protein
VISRSLAGMFAAQGLFLLAGVGIVWALRPLRTWLAVLRSLGLAYLTGVGAVGVLATLVLVFGGDVDTPVVLALSVGVAAAGATISAARRHRVPRSIGRLRVDRSPETVVAAAFALLTVAVLIAYYRAARHQGLVAWDAWAFWVPKAKAIYFFGGLDEQLFSTLANPSYPVLIPALQAMDFHLMGSADAATLAVQYWFLLVGFVVAAWSLLRAIVRPGLLWPFLALVTLLPEIDKRMINPQADWPLDLFFGICAIAITRWLLTEERWLLGVYGLMLAAMMATKREGQLFTFCLVVGLLLVTWRSARRHWPPLVVLAAAAYLVNRPWHHWWSSRHLSSDKPEVPFHRLPDYADRVGPAFRIVFEILFSYDLWLLVVPLALAAATLALARRNVKVPLLYLATCVLGILGYVWVLWAFPSLPLDTSQQEPIPREAGALAILSIVLAPVMLMQALGGPELRPNAHPAQDSVELTPIHA